ncbi:MAG: hypothetical protein WBG97_18485, partial [Pseudomonas sp.]
MEYEYTLKFQLNEHEDTDSLLERNRTTNPTLYRMGFIISVVSAVSSSTAAVLRSLLPTPPEAAA